MKCAKTGCEAEATHLSMLEFYTEGDDQPVRTMIGLRTCLNDVMTMEMLDVHATRTMAETVCRLNNRTGAVQHQRTRIVPELMTPENLRLFDKFNQARSH